MNRSTDADEVLVRVMDEEVAEADRGEDVGRLVLVRRHEPRRRHRRPRRALEVRPVELGEHVQAGQVEHALDLVGVVLAQAEAAQEDRWRVGRHGPLDLQADRLAEPPPSELLLDRHEEVVGLVFLDREVGVAGHPEEVVLEDLHAAEKGGPGSPR